MVTPYGRFENHNFDVSSSFLYIRKRSEEASSRVLFRMEWVTNAISTRLVYQQLDFHLQR